MATLLNLKALEPLVMFIQEIQTSTIDRITEEAYNNFEKCAVIIEDVTNIAYVKSVIEDRTEALAERLQEYIDNGTIADPNPFVQNVFIGRYGASFYDGDFERTDDAIIYIVRDNVDDKCYMIYA